MPISEIQFFFCALGAFASLCFGLYLIISKSKKHTSLIGWIILLVGLRVSISCLYFFSFNFSMTLVQLGLIAHLFSALLLLVYFKDYWLETKNKIPIVFFFAAILLFCIVFSFEKYPLIWDHTIRYIIHLVVGICLLFSTILLLKNKNLYQALKSQDGLIVVFYSLYCLVFGISLFTNYSLGPLLYSILTFVFLTILIFQIKTKSIPTKKYSNKKISESAIEHIEEGLKVHLIEKKKFVNPKLKISDVASVLGITIHELSEYLNDIQKISYPNYIKQLRVEEAKRLLVMDSNLSVEGVGFEAGFNSRSSFFSTFKKVTDVTPTAYKRSKMSSTL